MIKMITLEDEFKNTTSFSL